jgi:hypothetical protein
MQMAIEWHRKHKRKMFLIREKGYIIPIIVSTRVIN